MVKFPLLGQLSQGRLLVLKSFFPNVAASFCLLLLLSYSPFSLFSFSVACLSSFLRRLFVFKASSCNGYR